MRGRSGIFASVFILLSASAASAQSNGVPTDPETTRKYLAELTGRARQMMGAADPNAAVRAPTAAPAPAPAAVDSSRASLAQPAPAPRLQIRKGKLPDDPRYWAFNRWHSGHSVLNVIVDGRDQEHLADVLDILADLKKRKVLVGDIIVVGDTGAELSARGIVSLSSNGKGPPVTKRTPLGEVATELDLSHGTRTSAAALMAQYRVRYSPAWIVRYAGKDYIYEGMKDIRRMFTRDGQFLPDENEKASF